MSSQRAIIVKRTGEDIGQLIIEREIAADNVETAELIPERNVERFVFFLTREEIYSLARNALSAASEVVEIKKPGTY